MPNFRDPELAPKGHRPWRGMGPNLQWATRRRSAEIDEDTFATASGVCNAALIGVLLWLVLIVVAQRIWSMF